MKAMQAQPNQHLEVPAPPFSGSVGLRASEPAAAGAAKQGEWCLCVGWLARAGWALARPRTSRP